MRAEIVEARVGPFHEREDLGYAVRLIPENINEATLLGYVVHDYLHCSSEILDSRYRTPAGELVPYTDIPDMAERAACMAYAEVHFSKKPPLRSAFAASLSRVIERASRTGSGHRAMSQEELEHIILDAIENPYKLALRD